MAPGNAGTSRAGSGKDIGRHAVVTDSVGADLTGRVSGHQPDRPVCSSAGNP